METLDLALFYDESFVEFVVKNTKFNLYNKEIIINTKGAWLDRDENNVLSEAEIFISAWYSLKVSIMDEKTKIFTSVGNVENYILHDIIKFNYGQNILKLTGFGINGGWIEWEFVKPNLSIQGKIA